MALLAENLKIGIDQRDIFNTGLCLAYIVWVEPPDGKTRLDPKKEMASGNNCIVKPASKEEARKQLLTHTFELYVKSVKRYRGKEDRDWFADHADVLHPGIGTLALAVPPYFTGKAQPALKYMNISGLDDLVKQAAESTVPDNDVKGDHSQRIVGRAFRILNLLLEKEGRPMFVISQIHYDNVLGVLRRPSETKQTLVPVEVNTELSKRGDADLIILDKGKGVMIIEIKAVGDQQRSAGSDSDSFVYTNEIMLGVLRKAATKQLKKDVTNFHAVVGQRQGCQIIKIIAVPNMSSDLVNKLTADDPVVFKDIRFLCKDHLFTDDVSVPVSETDISSFAAWWQAIPQQEHVMDIHTMQEIVGRYAGLLSTAVTFSTGSEMNFRRSVEDNLYHTWRLFRRVVLTPAQLQVLKELKEDEEDTDGGDNRMKGRNYLSGPPGSGKTVLLRMRCRTFLAEKPSHQAVVVNMYRGAPGRAIGHHIHKEITTGNCFPGRIHLLNMDVGDLSQQKFTAKVKECFPQYTDNEISSDILFVIDEVHAETFWSDVLVALTEDFPRSRVLCAGIFSGTPTGFAERPLNLVLRCPPAVQNLLYQVDWCETRKMTYKKDYGHDKTLGTNGPQPICVRHQKHDRGPLVTDCDLCGEDLADFLLSPHTPGGNKAVAAPAGPDQPTRDMKVALLVNMPRSRYHESGDYVETTREDYDVYMRYVSACPLVATLTARGVQVHLKLDLACPDLYEDALGSPFLTWVYNFEGLEAGVVVYLPGDQSPQAGPSPREIPTLGLIMRGVTTSSDAQNPPVGDDTARGEERMETGRAKFKPRSPLNHWTSADVQRFSMWDQTNIMVAGSRCQCQLVLIVP